MPAMVVRFKESLLRSSSIEFSDSLHRGVCYGCRNSDSSPKCRFSRALGVDSPILVAQGSNRKKTETEKALAKNTYSRWSNHGGSCKRTIEWGQCNFGNLPTSPPSEAEKYIFLFFPFKYIFLSKHRIRRSSSHALSEYNTPMYLEVN